MTRGWALFWGLVLVLVGGLALLFNTGLLQPEQLTRVGELWPILLILVGLQIVLARLLPRNAAAITLSLIALVLVASSVGYVVSAPPAGRTHREFTVSDPGTGAATLHVSLGAATIAIEYGSPRAGIATAAVDYAGGSAPELRWDASSRTFDISHSVQGLVLGSNSPDRLTVTLASTVPWHVQLDTGASSISLRLGSPSGHLPVSINGGATELNIARPAGTELRVQLNGGANSLSVDGRDQGGAIGSLSWSSPGYSDGGDAYDVSIDGGANRVTVITSG